MIKYAIKLHDFDFIIKPLLTKHLENYSEKDMQKFATGKSFEDLKQFEKDEKLCGRIATVPNALCVLRIGMTPVIGYLVISECFIAACAILVAAAGTDILDGFIARNIRGQSSLIGSILDPVADKLFISTLFLTLTYVNLIPILLTIIVLLRDILLISGGLVKRYQMIESPVTFRKFFDPSVSPLRVAPTLISKLNTVLQISVVLTSTVSPILGFVDSAILNYLWFFEFV
ncbi:unnamed protein product [Dracunculus medinensis]|uniref:cardiolipin synthase (CMP-forming) n=1 Tax=Dracunculus medinensis TaxID=318479 RepID=A0A158Q364_DRAME|nr:unnamed protein product [Dracunculus medinensis]